MEYDDFRIEVTPTSDAGMPDRWNVKLIDCPISAMKGLEDPNLLITFTPEMLSNLRDPHGHPKPNLVQDAGTAVWNSLMGPKISGAFVTTLFGDRKGRGLRLVTVMRGKDSAAAGTGISPADLPVEAMHEVTRKFVTHDLNTPVVRSFSYSGDYDPGLLRAPLRILLIAACPNDLPTANITDEVAAIEETLKPFTDLQKIKIQKCVGATLADVQTVLAGRAFDIVHFVCHGSRGAGADSYLCLTNPVDNSTAPVDAGTLNALLKNCPVRLMIFSACSSAANPPAAAPASPYPVSAFSGIAQALIAANTQLGAVVAMQFDFETNAAVDFSKAFYGKLIKEKNSLEESVNFARKAVIARMGSVGHRAWVTPVIYSRSKPGPLFDLSQILDLGTLTQAEEVQLAYLQKMIGIHSGHVELMASTPGVSLIPGYQKGLTDLEAVRAEAAQLLKVSARLMHVSTKAGQTVEMNLRLLANEAIPAHQARIQLRLPSDKLELVKVTCESQPPPGGNGAVAGARKNLPFAVNEGRAELVVPSPDAANFQAGDSNLATLHFLVPPASPVGRIPVEVVSCFIDSNNGSRSIATLPAAVLVEAPPVV